MECEVEGSRLTIGKLPATDITGNLRTQLTEEDRCSLSVGKRTIRAPFISLTQDFILGVKI